MITPHRKILWILLSFLVFMLISCNSVPILTIINKIDSVAAEVVRTILSDLNFIKETETPAAQKPSDVDKSTTADILPTEGILSGNNEHDDVNNCNHRTEISIDLEKRVYSYTLTGSCDYSTDYDVVDIGLGGGVVHGDGYLEGKTTVEETKTCRPGKNCLEEWLKGEKHVFDMVGYIDIPASTVTVCEFYPDSGNGEGWDISTFRSFANEYGEFYCPTWPEIFKVVLAP